MCFAYKMSKTMNKFACRQTIYKLQLIALYYQLTVHFILCIRVHLFTRAKLIKICIQIMSNLQIAKYVHQTTD